MAPLRDVFQGLARSGEELRAENLRKWASTIPDAVPITKVQPRQRCRVAGVVQNIRIDPREGRGSIEATLIDGTGDLVAKWLGRQTLSGIRLGMGLVVEGIAGTGDQGELVILNPEYLLVPGPEHG
ncbi:MAG: DNA-binding protein [Actinomycetota bacterium]